MVPDWWMLCLPGSTSIRQAWWTPQNGLDWILWNKTNTAWLFQYNLRLIHLYKYSLGFSLATKCSSRGTCGLEVRVGRIWHILIRQFLPNTKLGRRDETTYIYWAVSSKAHKCYYLHAPPKACNCPKVWCSFVFPEKSILV